MNILVAISGGIAAYKTATLVRCLKKAEVEVRVVMTRDAKNFITPLTMATLSGNPILVENFDPENGAWNSHISLGEWADAMIIAPATANTIAKMAHGIADNLLLTTYLSARCPVWIAPAMDMDMFAHQATQTNIEILKARGVHVIEPTEGFLASGLCGKGRMAEPETIAQQLLVKANNKSQELAGKNILVTAGATVENIDPVRFISNYSSGKMGVALAEELSARGANVTIVKAATTAITHNPKIKIIEALSAQAMLQAVNAIFNTADIVIFAAAVADYTPANPASQKIKHDNTAITLELKPTQDIAAIMGAKKKPRQITVGFALETNNALKNATRKLISKKLDAIVINSLEDTGAGFAGDTNKITILSNKSQIEYPLKTKTEVAADIVDYIISEL